MSSLKPCVYMTISLHFVKVLNDTYIRFNHLLENLDQNWIDAESFAEAIHSAGSPLDNCWGFIDGTLRPCCRPIRNQRILFSGHKRTHGLKFQVERTAGQIECYRVIFCKFNNWILIYFVFNICFSMCIV